MTAPVRVQLSRRRGWRKPPTGARIREECARIAEGQKIEEFKQREVVFNFGCTAVAEAIRAGRRKE